VTRVRAGSAAVFALLAAAAASYLTALRALMGYTVDDAYITFRYAHNLARGWGLTFNQAPPRAEGYSSVLWTLLTALPEALRMDTVLCAKILGLLLTAGMLGLVAWAVLRVGAARAPSTRRVAAAFACALVLAFPCAAAHAISGMETALAAFLVALAAALFLASADEPRAEAALPWAALALGLTRPEANLFALGLVVAHLFELPRARRGFFVRIALLGYVLPGAAYFVARMLYYGHPFPLPYYVKATSSGLPGLHDSMSFAGAVAIGALIPIALLVASSRRRPLLLIAAAAPIPLYFLKVEPIMGYGHRYLFPMLPAIAVVAGAGLLAAYDRGRWARAACIAGLAAACAIGYVRTKAVLPDYLAYEHGLENAHGRLARALRGIAWTAPPTLAIGDAGLVPYVTDLSTIDTFGLNEPAIAAPPRSDRVTYVLGRRPTVLVLISRRRDRFTAALPHEAGLGRAAFAAGYEGRAAYRFADDYWLWVLWRPRTPDADRIDLALPRGG
jgi:hypothetical protein